MDLRTSLFYKVNLVIFSFVTITNCFPGASAELLGSSKTNNVLDAIVACDSVKFLRNSSYVSQCKSLLYPIEFKQDQDDVDIKFMCKTFYHVTNKICEYDRVIDKSRMKMPETAEKFDEEMKNLEPTHENKLEVVQDWCQNMTAFLNTSILHDTNKDYIKYADEILLNGIDCRVTCQAHHGVNHFCVVFYWFDKLYNTLPLSKKLDIRKETADSKQQQQVSYKIKTDDNIENPVIHPDDNHERTSVVNTKAHVEEQSNLQIPDMDIQNNLKAESVASANEQEMKKKLDRSSQEIIPEKQQWKQDSKLPSSTDNKLNVEESKIENPKTELQEGNNSFLDEEGKKSFQEAVDSDNEHGIMETNKKDSYSDSGDQHSLQSPITKEDDDSHFFIYFSIVSFACVTLYIGYRNKQKILAMVLEGRQSRTNRGSSRRRPNTANYRKLDSNLEEAVTSRCNSNVTHVIY